MEQIRNVRPGDEDSLAYVQTESWKAAFREIVPADILAECTALESTAAMYRRILDEGFGNGYLMELDGKPHCIAWWSVARDANMAGYAELICLHSLQENWRKGYGRAMMERVLADVKKAGYEKLVLWVFENNTRAIQFYKSFGFEPSGRRRPSLGAVSGCSLIVDNSTLYCYDTIGQPLTALQLYSCRASITDKNAVRLFTKGYVFFFERTVFSRMMTIAITTS